MRSEWRDSAILGAWTTLGVGGVARHFVEEFGLFSATLVVAEIRDGETQRHEVLQKVWSLVGDPTGTITRNFGVMIEEEGIALRGTFVINPEGIIKACEIHDNGIGRDAAELMRKVKAAQYVAANPGEVCPAKWKEGASTLKPSLDLIGKI